MTVKGRYISPVQAIWRPYAYAIHEEKPAVILLPYHLKGEHHVSFGRNLKEAQVAAAIEPQPFIFMNWMRYYVTTNDGCDLCLSEFSVFNTYIKRRERQKIKKGQTIGTMSVAVPRLGERLYLGPLLTVKRGERSYLSCSKRKYHSFNPP